MNKIERTNEQTELLKEHCEDFIIAAKRFAKWISRSDTGPRAEFHLAQMENKEQIMKDVMSYLKTQARKEKEVKG